MQTQIPSGFDPKYISDDPTDLVERIEIKIKPKKESELVNWIDDEKSQIQQARSKFVERHKKFLYNWDDFVTYTRNGPWDGSSNLHMPITAIKAKSYISRIYNIFTDENTTQLIPVESSDDKFVSYMKDLRRWYLWDYLNGYKGIRGFAREVFTDCVTIGFGIGIKDWETQIRKVIDIEVQELQKEMADLRPQVEESGTQELQTEEEMEVSSVSTKPYKEVEKILTVFEGSRVRSVPFENAYFPNFIPESSDLDFPKCVIITADMRVSDVWVRIKKGVWDKKRGKKVIERGDQDIHSKNQTQIQRDQERLSGWEIPQAKDMRVIEYCFCTYDIDEDGIDEEIIVTKCDKEIIKVVLLDRISPSGMRPLYKFDCFSKPRQAYSRGVPEFLYPLNEEADQHHNMRLDYLALQTCPFGVYRGASSLKNQPIQISPGKFIPVDEVTDMRVLNFNTSATALASEEDRSWHLADLLTSTSSLNQGIVPQQVGPVRSTSGALTLLRQMDKEFILTIDALAAQWKKMEKMLIDDLDHRISPQIKMRVLGASVQDAIKANKDPFTSNSLAINSQFDIRIDVARAVTSEEVRRNDAEMIFNKFAAPSVLQQMGVVGPKTLYWSVCNWLRAFGYNENDIISKPDFLDKPLTLFQEIQICGQGEVPQMAMNDEHDVKAQNLMAFMQSPEFQEALQKGLYQPSSLGVFQATIKKHLTLAEMLKPQGMPNPMGQNDADMNQLLAGGAPQQGGNNPNMTTSRDLGGQDEGQVPAGAGGEAPGA